MAWLLILTGEVDDAGLQGLVDQIGGRVDDMRALARRLDMVTTVDVHGVMHLTELAVSMLGCLAANYLGRPGRLRLVGASRAVARQLDHAGLTAVVALADQHLGARRRDAG
ncbi:hypothetical protein [Cellulomonas sp. Y8]|uniref:hypothetical protein n=1 Tax=Cellulomonas sp. Y8 TaxID=2591145 RepID=UPI003D75DF24